MVDGSSFMVEGIGKPDTTMSSCYET